MLIGLVAPVEFILARRAGEPSRLADLFRRVPTRASLRCLENDLESRSRLAQAVRPWSQFLRFAVFHDTGDKALLGRDGWFFLSAGGAVPHRAVHAPGRPVRGDRDLP